MRTTKKLSKAKIFTIDETRSFFGGVSKTTLRAWHQQGILKRKSIGGRVFYTEAEILRVLEK